MNCIYTFVDSPNWWNLHGFFFQWKKGTILISYKDRSQHKFHSILLQSSHAFQAQRRNTNCTAMNEGATNLLLCWATLVKAINIQFLTRSQLIFTSTWQNSITQPEMSLNIFTELMWDDAAGTMNRQQLPELELCNLGHKWHCQGVVFRSSTMFSVCSLGAHHSSKVYRYGYLALALRKFEPCLCYARMTWVASSNVDTQFNFAFFYSLFHSTSSAWMHLPETFPLLYQNHNTR